MYMDWDTPLISHESWIGTLWVLNLFLLSSQPSGTDRSVWIEWNSNLVAFSPISSCAFSICQCTPLAALQIVIASLCGQSCVPHPCSHCCSPSIHPSIRRANLMSHLWQSYTAFLTVLRIHRPHQIFPDIALLASVLRNACVCTCHVDFPNPRFQAAQGVCFVFCFHRFFLPVLGILILSPGMIVSPCIMLLCPNNWLLRIVFPYRVCSFYYFSKF